MIRYTVDGRNPATPGMYKTINQRVQDFFHQHYHILCNYTVGLFIYFYISDQSRESINKKNQLLPAVAMLSKNNIIQRFKTKVSVKFHQQMDSSRN